MANLIKGLDISVVQGVVDCKAIAASGVEFIICRCGVGNSGKDSTYNQNVANAKAAGLKVMAYHFVYPLPTTSAQPLRDPVAQAKLHAGYANGELAACDLEWPTVADWGKWGCTAAQIGQWAIDYLAAYEAITGIKPIVYTYPDFAHHVNLPAVIGQNYKLWIASYGGSTPTIPAPWTDWVMWQDTGGGGKLPNGAPVDTDKVRDLSLWDAAPAVSAVSNFPAPIPMPVISPPPPAPLPPPVVTNPNMFSLVGQLFSGIIKKYTK